MSPGARSLAIWTGYVIVLGGVLLLFPNWFLSIFRIEETSEVWIRIVGMLLIGLGPYYWTAVRGEFSPMITASVWVRWAIAAALVVLAITAGPWQLVLFATVDFLGGLWTYLATRNTEVADTALRPVEDLQAEDRKARQDFEDFMGSDPGGPGGFG